MGDLSRTAVSDGRWSKVRAWVTANTVAALTLSGLILYVILRLPYSIYYGRLGSSPEDIGLDYISLLSQSVLGVLSVALVIVCVLALAFLVTVYIKFLGMSSRRYSSLWDYFRIHGRLRSKWRTGLFPRWPLT